ncbi:energy-coupling factor ABC transporter permease [Planctomycetota bacterium]
MHMGNEVLSPSVALGFSVASVSALAVCAKQAQRKLEGRQLPLMGMMGALVFAAQMVNFQILGGSSGHLGGGALLAIVLGPEVAVFVMSAVLFIQAVVFNDGGLLALGTNIFNMGILPAFLGYGCFRLFVGREAFEAQSAGRVYLGCFVAGLLGVTAGAAMVPIQVGLSGLLQDGVSLSWFLATMTWVHLIIGAVEGVVTFLVVAYLYHARADLLPGGPKLTGRVSVSAVLASLGVAALVAGCVISMLASGLPDGLEYVLGVEAADNAETGEGTDRSAGGRLIVREPAESSLMARTSAFQERIAVLPDYTHPATGDAEEEQPERLFQWDSFQAISGVTGSALTLLLAFAIGRLLSRRAKAAAEATG